MKAETVVDLFQFIKAARVQRAGLVANKVRIEMFHLTSLSRDTSLAPPDWCTALHYNHTETANNLFYVLSHQAWLAGPRICLCIST